MSNVLIRPLYEQGDLVCFKGYIPRRFPYTVHSKKWDAEIAELDCPLAQVDNIFVVIITIPAKELFKRSSHPYLTCKDNGYIVVSQRDGVRYFVYEDELEFL